MLLTIDHVKKSFGGVHAVKDVTIKVDDNEIIGIIGPNGAGKTTILNLISGIYPVDEGTITFLGKDLKGMSAHNIARMGLSRTFQNIRLFKGLTVEENVMTSLDATAHYSIFSAITSLGAKRRVEKENRVIVGEVLEELGLAQYKDERPENLPYGLQRRVELARAVVTKPKLLMLDEPAAGLNPNEIDEFIDLIRELRQRYGFGILFIEHRMKVVNELAEYIYVVNFGELLAEGKPAEVVNNPEVIKAYIGEEEVK